VRPAAIQGCQKEPSEPSEPSGYCGSPSQALRIFGRNQAATVSLLHIAFISSRTRWFGQRAFFLDIQLPPECVPVRCSTQIEGVWLKTSGGYIACLNISAHSLISAACCDLPSSISTFMACMTNTMVESLIPKKPSRQGNSKQCCHLHRNSGQSAGPLYESSRTCCSILRG